ncbi:MAG: peptidoglycan-associated lipoprotein Pal [Pseudomonadaceae bacterium]|nr:peptidoglycan-associated lipoprotein Pal [Pseudomonadaceae bacterium]
MKITKLAALAAVAALGACSCLKSPDLDVAPVANASNYGAGSGYTSGGAANDASVKEMFAAGGFNMVYFDYDSAAITDSAAATLQQFASFAKEHNVQGVTVEGHCDERGTREYNLALGERRAVAVKKYLAGLGVDAGNVTTISYGKERPAVEGHDEAAWAKNRRGVIVLN